MQPQYDIPFAKSFVKMLFEVGIDKFSDSLLMNVSYAYFLQDVLGLYMKVVVNIKKI